MRSDTDSRPDSGHAAPIRLIATDLDGTFLGADTLPSADNRDAVLQAAALGVPTVFATGRPAPWLRTIDLVRQARPRAITSNGAMIVDLATAEILHTFPLDTDVTSEVIRDIRAELPRATFSVEFVDGWGADANYPTGDRAPANLIVRDPLELLSAGTIVKLLVRAGIPTTELMEQVAPIVADRLNVTFSVLMENGFLEMSRPGVDKGTTLHLLLDELGISPADVAAFGDMPNDLPMLDLVGHPYVMDNAHDLLKQRGFPICGHHDNSAFATTVRDLLGLPDPDPAGGNQ